MKETIELKEFFEAEPSEIYNAWLDSELHGKMTGGEADCSKELGKPFSAWDGYISGTNIELIENEKIVQNWRTSEFAENDEDSLLQITLAKVSEGSELTLKHTNIPEGQIQYLQGWHDHYLTPMKTFFQK